MKNKLTERQLFLLKKAIEFIDDAGGYSTINWQVEGYDGVDFDAGMLSEDLKIEFELEN